MREDYLIVHKSVLPDFMDKVIDTRKLLESGEVKDVIQAVKRTGISRSTYYKYKDMVFEPSEMSEGRRAVIMFMLSHVPGTLSGLLNCISSVGANVLTITQSIPINDSASVTVSLEISSMSCSIQDLIGSLSGLEGIQSLRLISIE